MQLRVASLFGFLAFCASAQSGNVSVMGVFNSSPPTLSSGNLQLLQIDSSGRLLVDCTAGCGGSGGTASSFGAAFPSQGTAAGFKDVAGNMAGGNLDLYGNLKISQVAPFPVPVVIVGTAPPAIPSPPLLPVNPAPVAVLDNLTPCALSVPQDAAVSQAATSRIITGRPGFRILVCHERLIVGAAEQTSEIEGTGTTCGTGTVVHSGSSTAANGEQLAANGGYETNVPFYLLSGNDYCIQQAGTARVAGKVSYLYVP